MASVEEQCGEFVEALRSVSFADDAKNVVKTLMRIISNVIAYPDEEKYRHIRTKNATVKKLVEEYSKSLEYLALLGFKRHQDGSEVEYVLPRAKLSIDILRKGFSVLAEVAPEMGLRQDEIPSLEGAFLPNNETMIFDPYVETFISLSGRRAPLGENSKLEKEVEQLKEKRDNILQSAGIPERSLRVFYQKGAAAQKTERVSLVPNIFKDSSKKDIDILATVKAHREEQQRKSQRLSTSAMREFEKLKVAKVYTKTVIRVQFPDRVIIEAHFSPTETVGDVFAEISKCLKPSLNSSFTLYQAPPQRDLDFSKTLDEAGLKPAALIHARWTKGNPESDYLRDDLVVSSSEEISFAYPKSSVDLFSAEVPQDIMISEAWLKA